MLEASIDSGASSMNDMKLDTRKLRQLREARAWSQERLAEAAGLSSRSVQRVEADGRTPRC